MTNPFEATRLTEEEEAHYWVAADGARHHTDGIRAVARAQHAKCEAWVRREVMLLLEAMADHSYWMSAQDYNVFEKAASKARALLQAEKEE